MPRKNRIGRSEIYAFSTEKREKSEQDRAKHWLQAESIIGMALQSALSLSSFYLNH
jgi:hypothetical protein